jgi:hypothetical protein
VTYYLVLLAADTRADEVDNLFVHLGPPKVSANQFDSLVLTQMASDLRIVFLFENLSDQVFLLRHPKHTLLIE